MNDESRVNMSMSVPMAIVIAGAFIAAAIYFSIRTLGGGAVLGTAPQQPGAQVPAASPTPKVVGEFRPVDPAKDHIRGASNPVVTIIEYSDLECPFCKRFHETMKQVLTAYPDKVAWVYRHAPLVQLHSKAPAEANAAECASEQGKFWEFVDKVFAVTPANDGLDPAQIPLLARQVGVANIAQFESCVNTNKYADLVQADLADAEGAGMEGTPYSVAFNAGGTKLPINGALPLASVQAVIDSLLK